MARPVSAAFKEAWKNKQGNPDFVQVRFKRRYFDGASFVNEADWTVLEQIPDHVLKPGFVGIGDIANVLDAQFQNVMRVTTITLRMRNTRNEWIESLAVPSVFAADDVAELGYKLFKTIFQVRMGYILPGDTEPTYTEMFTGNGLRPRITSDAGESHIDVISFLGLLERSDPAQIVDSVTLEDMIPPTGDGSNTDFETTSIGIERVSDVQQAASSLLQGSQFTISNIGKVVEAGNTGRALAKLAAAPTGGQTMKATIIKWKQGEKIEDLADDVCDNADLTDRQIDPVLLPNGVNAQHDVDDQGEWEAGTAVLVNIDTTSLPGSIRAQWLNIDDFVDTDFSARWSGSTSGWSILSGKLRGVSTADLERATTKVVGSFEANIFPTSGLSEFFIMRKGGIFVGDPVVKYVLKIAGVSGAWSLVKRKNIAGDTVLLSGSVAIDAADLWRVTRDSSGEFKVYINTTLLGTVTNTELTASVAIGIKQIGGTGDFDDFRFSNEVLSAVTDASTLATPTYTSEEFDSGGAPTAWGVLDSTQVLNGGTIGYETDVAASSGGPFDGFVAVGGGNQILSNLKQFPLFRATITPLIYTFDTPQIDRATMNFTTSVIIISLANFSGLNGLDALEELAAIPDYEVIMDGAGKLFMRSKNVSGDPEVILTQENGIIRCLDYDTGEDRVRNVGRVRYNEYVSEYDKDSASEAEPTSQREFGRIVIEQNFSRFLLSNDVNIAEGRAQVLYEARFQRVKRWRLLIWIVPWLEVSDKIRFSLFDHPSLEKSIAGDPLAVMESGYFSFGQAQNVLARDQDAKVLEYKPNPDTNTAEILVEAI